MSPLNENIPKLGAEEVRAINENLGRSAELRKNFAPGAPLTIVIDGEACGSLDPDRQRRFRHEVSRKSEWVEVHDHGRGGDLLLAAHLYRHEEVPPNGRKRKYSTVLEGGQKIIFVAYNEDEKSFVEISYRETNVLKALALFSRQLKNAVLGPSHSGSSGLNLVLAPVIGLTTRQLGYALASACLLIPLAVILLRASRPAEVAHKPLRPEPTRETWNKVGPESSPTPPAPPPHAPSNPSEPLPPSAAAALAPSIRGLARSRRIGYARARRRPRTDTNDALASLRSNKKLSLEDENDARCPLGHIYTPNVMLSNPDVGCGSIMDRE